MNDEMRRKLTEYLGECWHEDQSSIYHPNTCNCGKEYGEDRYGMLLDHIRFSNRTFTTRTDMMDLYEAIWKNKHYFPNFHDYAVEIWSELSPPTEQWDSFTAWLFCLDGKYDRGCRLVGEWLGGVNEKFLD